MIHETTSSRVRARLLQEMKDRKMSQTDIAGILEWTQPRVSKILHGRVELGVEELSALCFAVGISLTEAVRDRGMEFCAEMTPTELRFLERLRQLPTSDRDAFLQVLGVKLKTAAPERRASGHTPAKRKAQ